MPAFRPARAVAPKSKLRVPYRERAQTVPQEEDPTQKAAPLQWQRRLPYKLVQGSHIGHGMRMEPMRSEPPDWKTGKRRLKFSENEGAGKENNKPIDLTAAPANAPAAAVPGKPTYAKSKDQRVRQRAAQHGGRARGAPPIAQQQQAIAAAGHRKPPARKRPSKEAAGKAAAPEPSEPAPPLPPPAAAKAARPRSPEAAPTGGENIKPIDLTDPADPADDLRSRLQLQAFEVECTLRPTLSDATALAAAKAGVADALAFDEELATLSAEHTMSKGRLFQALLEQLRVDGADHAQTDNSHRENATSESNEYATTFGAAKWHTLAKRADSLRQLVRVKVADDNDLRTAKSGFLICKQFFDGLEELARTHSEDEFDLLTELRSTSA